MDVQHRLCSRQTIELFLADQLSAAEQRAFEDHLEGCLACRQTLDRMAAEGSWWEEARGYLASARPLPSEDSSAPDRPNLSDESQEDALAALSGLKSYLAPTDDPRMLGRLGGYEITGLIGSGGMGIVLKGFDAPLNRYVAIKVLGPQLAMSAAARQRFAREAKAAATVVHPNVMAIHAVAETNGLPYFVMPYVRGPSLEKRLQQTGAFAVVEIVRIGMQIASGLAAAHAQGLVHRDIKPANILLEEGVERVTITDFGLARAGDDASLTKSGVIAGTPQYMSPEQASGQPVDHRSDLFSLGSVLYALCTGRPPFRADTILAVLRRVEEDRPRPIREINPDVPEWLAVIVGRLQAKDPAHRFQSAAEAAALLEGYLAHLQQPATVPAPPLPPLPLNIETRRQGDKETRRRRQPLRFLVLFLLTIMAALGLAIALTIAVVADGEGSRGDEIRPAPAASQEIHHSFKGNPESRQHFDLIGPNADSCVKFEAEGLRITLPPGYGAVRDSTGLALATVVKGDFEVTLDFEILKEPEPADTGLAGTRLSLGVFLNTPQANVATLSRSVGAKAGSVFVAWTDLWNDEAGKSEKQSKYIPTQAKTGRLRLVRSDAVLSFYVSEGPDGEFTLLQQYRFGEEDLKEIRIAGSTGGPKASLDARVTDLHIRAKSVAVVSAAPLQKPSGGKGGLLIVLGAALALTLALGVGLYVYHRRRAGIVPAPAAVAEEPARADLAPPSIAIACSGCGKKLKVKAELAGKKVKCPQCGQVVSVPGSGESAGAGL